MRERIEASRDMTNMIQHIYIKQLKSCHELGIPMLSSYLRVIFLEKIYDNVGR